MKGTVLKSPHLAANEIRFSRCHGLPYFISHSKGALAVQERWPTASSNPSQFEREGPLSRLVAIEE
jgi:hypothetical protein